jgi:drug/metabolite transporter (DMT)-like permease
MHIGAIFAKLGSESLLSLYPIFVKKIGISSTLQLWTRLITYVGIASLFVDWSFITKSIGSLDAITLGLINLSHIYFSYEGFRHLDSGVSFAMFNSYPLMILLIAGIMEITPRLWHTGSQGTPRLWHNSYLLVLIGLAMFIYGNEPETNQQEQKPVDFNYGTIMILLAALTEALIYFLIKRIPTTNHWNHVFIAYFLGAAFMSGYIINIGETGAINDIKVLASVIINGIIGSLGYFLRFFASFRLSPEVYAPLSYFGVVMSYVYGILFNNEQLTIPKTLGTLSILASNYFAPKV